MNELRKLGRIAFREEGDRWNAYYALPHSMKGAIPLGSIRINIVRTHPDLKEAFIQLMREVLNHYLQEMLGREPEWGTPEPAPEAERSGHA